MDNRSVDRRAFLKGAFGLVVLTAGASVGVLGASGCGVVAGAPFYITPASGEPETAKGPLMMAGIELHEVPDTDRVAAYFEGVELFNVNEAGAAVVRLADGERTIGEIAAETAALGHEAAPLDVALFFSSLCQAGYLRNIVSVSVMETAE